MYWPVALNKEVRESLEDVIAENCARSSRSAEFADQDSTDSNKEEEPVNRKRTSSHFSQIKKKKSISNIKELQLSDSVISVTHIFAGETSSEDEEEELYQQETMAAFNHNEAWCRIKQLAITSKHFTPRDKNELLAQEPTFAAIDDLVAISAAINVNNGTQVDIARKARLDHLVNNAIAQLKLYYLVGTEGWATAIATVKSAEAARIGLPEVKHEPKPQIIYVNQKSNYQSYQSNASTTNGYGRKSYGRRPYKKH